MITPISFTVDMVPQGKARPRHTRTGRTYTPSQTVKAEQCIADAARPHFAQKLVVPVAVRIEAIFPVPNGWPKYRRAAAIAGDVRPVVKPDGDNIAKLVLDALNEIAWADDKQVTDLRVVKRYGAFPGLFIKVGEA
jgi:Holliday junction resolvase RusA-like endonuclease